MVTLPPPGGPKAVEKEEIAAPTKEVEAYPALPNPVTVEVMLAKVMVPPPGPKAVEKEEIEPAIDE